MRINYNAPAMRAHNALNIADNRVAASLQKLSSGYKVNSAKDNPSGYAIGRRMNTQITGIGVGRQNANTGISIIETADGALTEVHEMLQRMNELAVKGETGTLTTTDRMMLNQEFQQLKAEIARIAKDTEFNGQTLLNGSFDLKGYTNNLAVKVGYYSDDVLEKVYTVDKLNIYYDKKGKIDLDKTKASFVPGNNFPKGVEITSVGENCVTITDTKGFEITLDVEPPEEIKREVDIQCGLSDAHLQYYADEIIDINPGNGMESATYYIAGIHFDYDDISKEINSAGLTVGSAPELEVSNITGSIVTIADSNGFEVTIDFRDSIDRAIAQGSTSGQLHTWFGMEFSINVTGGPHEYEDLTLDITGIGAMTTQIGANEGQVLDIRIPTISLQRLGITGAEVTTEEKSADANVAIKGAIAYVSDARSRLGAYQNRLEHTVSSLDITNENMTASYSRIMDVDISEEMTYYTSQTVVEQAAISMLAQANERPSQVLQLLQ